MLIDLTYLLKKYCLSLRGVIHGGAHTCEEMDVYKKNGLSESNVLWFEANPSLVENMRKINSAIQIYPCALFNESDKVLNFFVTNNFQSSSLLALETHKRHYPNIIVNKQIQVRTIRLDDFLQREGKSIKDYNMLNLDIQGAELLAIYGLGDLIKEMEFLYLEVNREKLYKDCALVGDLDRYLCEKGFVRVETHWVQQNWGDALYLRFDVLQRALRENPTLKMDRNITPYEN